jgi:putative sugar O-methyltransferase
LIWESQTKSALNEIKQFGLKNFRGCSNGICTSYGDNAYIDSRGSYNYGIRSLFAKLYRDVFPFNKLFDSQVALTRFHFDESVKYKGEYYRRSERVQFLLNKYSVPIDNLRGGCLSFFSLNDKKISLHYIQLLDTLDVTANYIDLSSRNSFFEIGGGFGVNTHLLIENFPNIRKIIYLDIPPNLYVGTQYLKSFYGPKVKTYRETKGLDTISFAPNDELEIICITPEQIEKLNCEIDLFHNAGSFVEMPQEIVANYASHVERLLTKTSGAISLVSYDGFDLNTTFNPDNLPSFFKKPHKKYEVETVNLNHDFHYII